MPHLKELVERHQDDPFVLIGVNTGDSPEDYRKGLKDFEVTWLSAYQSELAPIAQMYKVQGYPTYLVLDAEGKIVSRGHDPNVDDTVARLVKGTKK